MSMVVDEPTTSVATRKVSIPLWALALALVFCAAVGVAVGIGMMSQRGVPRIARGVVTAVEFDLSALGFAEDGGDGQGESIPIAAEVNWTDRDGANFTGTVPTCLQPDSAAGQRVELAILDLHGSGTWPTKLVVWVHCLS